MSYGDDQKNGKTRVIVMVLSSVFLAAMVVAATVTVGRRQNQVKTKVEVTAHKQVSSSMKAIKSVCQPTDYEEKCVESLQTEARNTTDPKELVRAAFQVAKKQVIKATKTSTAMKAIEKEPRSNIALEACKDLMDEAVEDFDRSFEEMAKFGAGSKLGPIVDNLKTWLSATITYQETCLEGFENTTGEAGEKMRKVLKTSMELSINAIAIVSQISSVLGTLDMENTPHSWSQRRLLDNSIQILGHGDLYPNWIHRRRLVQNQAQILGHGDLYPFRNWIHRRRLLQNHVHVLGHGDMLPFWLRPGNRRLLSLIDPAQLYPDIVVAKDGSGNCSTINEALNLIPNDSNRTTIIYIKKGIYEERVFVNRSTSHIFMVGDGADKTRITGSLNYIDGTPTMKTATVSVLGEYFMAKNIGFENSAGPKKHQAVALRVDADMSIFYNCSMDGYQATLYAHAKRQYYRDCNITGTIDFIFGDGSAVFQNCKLIVRKPLDNQLCIVTAQGRNVSYQPTAIVIQNSSIIVDPLYYPVRHKIKSYLGRPRRIHSRTVIIESFIDDLIQPEGWLPWEGEFGIHTCFYTEYGNYGPGANKSGRVTWKGVKSIDRSEALEFTAGKFLNGDAWIKPSGVPYVSGFVTTETY